MDRNAFDLPYSYVAGSLPALKKHLTVFPKVEVACIFVMNVNLEWAQLMVSGVKTNQVLRKGTDPRENVSLGVDVMMRISQTAAFVWLAVLALACGGGGSGGGDGDGDSSNLNEAASDATTEGVEELCREFFAEASGDFTLEQLCNYQAVIHSENRTDCVEFAQSCITAEHAPWGGDEDLCPFNAQGFAGCDVSIAELKDCLSRNASTAERVFTTVSCDNRAVADDYQVDFCKPIFDRCPGLFGAPDDN